MKVSCFFLKKPSCETRNTDYLLTLPAVIESSQCSTYFNMTITWPTSDTFKTFDIRETSKWGHFKLINHHPYNNRLEDDMFYKKSVPKIKDIRSFFFGGYIYIYIHDKSWWQLKHVLIKSPGEMIQFDLRIFFQKGWFNHQRSMSILRMHRVRKIAGNLSTP